MVLVRTATLLLVATYSDTMYPSVCVEAVEKLGTVSLSISLCLSENVEGYPVVRPEICVTNNPSQNVQQKCERRKGDQPGLHGLSKFSFQFSLSPYWC